MLFFKIVFHATMTDSTNGHQILSFYYDRSLNDIHSNNSARKRNEDRLRTWMDIETEITLVLSDSKAPFNHCYMTL